MSPLLVATSPDSLPAPLSCVPPSFALCVLLSHPSPYVVVASASVADPSDSAPLHSALLSALSSLSAPPTWYSPHDPGLFTWWCSCKCPLRTWTVFAAVTSIIHVLTPGSPLVLPSLSLFLSPNPAPPARRPSVSCCRPPSPFPGPWPPISPARKNMSEIRWAGLKQAGQWRAELRCAGISLTGP